MKMFIREQPASQTGENDSKNFPNRKFCLQLSDDMQRMTYKSSSNSKWYMV